MKLRFMYQVLMSSTLLILLASAAAAQAVTKAPDQPAVVAAVAPTYPPIAKSSGTQGDVVVEVKIDAQGKVTSAATISGHAYLRKSSETAALRWQFAAMPQEPKERIVRLTFGYTTISEIRPDDPQLVVWFKPPYRVEVKFNPPIVD